MANENNIPGFIKEMMKSKKTKSEILVAVAKERDLMYDRVMAAKEELKSASEDDAEILKVQAESGKLYIKALSQKILKLLNETEKEIQA